MPELDPPPVPSVQFDEGRDLRLSRALGIRCERPVAVVHVVEVVIREDVGLVEVECRWLVEMHQALAHRRVLQRRHASPEWQTRQFPPSCRCRERRAVVQPEKATDAAGAGLRPQLGTLGILFLREADHPAVQIRSPVAVRDPEGYADVVLARELAHPGDFRAGLRQMRLAVTLADPQRTLEDPFAAMAEDTTDREQFARVGVRAGHVATVGDLVQERPGCREPQRASTNRFVDERAHPADVVLPSRRLVEAALAHGVDAHRTMSHHATDIDALVHAVDGFEVLAEGFPVPRQPGVDRFLRDVLYGLHHLRQIAAVLRLAGSERHAAVACHHRGHAVVARRRRNGVPGDLRIEVRVNVHETRRDGLAVGVDLVPCLPGDLPDRDDALAADADVGPSGGGSRSVDDSTVADDQVVTHCAHLLPRRGVSPQA